MALAALGALVLRTNFLIDDAFISFRYGRNWAETGTPAYNPGSAPPVEGYSNFLWVLALRVMAQVGLELESASRVLSVLCGAATVVLVHRFLLATLGLGALAAALGAIALAAFPPFAVWCTGGLESAAFGLALFASFALLLDRGEGGRGERDRRAGVTAGLCGLCVALLRVEGLLWSLGLAVCAGVAGAGGPGRLRRRLGPYLALVLVGFGAFLLWRRATYGEWMANTVLAKAGMSGEVLGRGLRTTASYLVLFVSPVIALVALPLTARGERRGAALGCAAVVAAFLVYDTLVGGDWMPFFRFLAPATPFLAVLLALLFQRLPREGALAAAAACVGVALAPVFGASLVPRGVREALYFRTFRVGYETEWQRWQTGQRNLDMFVKLGKGLGQIRRPGDSLTFGAIGAVGYYSGMVIHDRNGLVDREVARHGVTGGRSAGHDKQVPRAFFLDRRPTLFHGVFAPFPIGDEDSDTYRAALDQTVQRVFGEGPGEEPLREACLPEVHALRPDEGIPPGSSLMVLRATEDAGRARAFWDRVLGPR